MSSEVINGELRRAMELSEEMRARGFNTTNIENEISSFEHRYESDSELNTKIQLIAMNWSLVILYKMAQCRVTKR